MKFLNFGSLNIDYVYQVPHFVQKGETLASNGYTQQAGGKGLNQSIALAKAGGCVYHAGKIGQDGAFLLDLLKEAGVHCEYIACDGSVCGHAMIQVTPAGDNCILLFGGANQEITEAQITQVFQHFDEGDVLLLQNEINHLPEILAQARKKKLRIVWNPSPITEDVFAQSLDQIDVLIVNEVEAQAFSHQHEPQAILSYFATTYPQVTLVLTLGEQGAWFQDQKQRFHQPAFSVKAVDTTAAGDTFLGYFTAVYFTTKDARQALETATKASALAVMKQGACASIPTKQEVEAFHQE